MDSEIESNLESRIKTPRSHRSELTRHVKRPLTKAIKYVERCRFTPLLAQLKDVLDTYEMTRDPYILALKQSQRELDRIALEKALAKQKTLSLDQLKGIYRRAIDIAADVGRKHIPYVGFLSPVTY